MQTVSIKPKEVLKILSSIESQNIYSFEERKESILNRELSFSKVNQLTLDQNILFKKALFDSKFIWFPA